MKATKDMLKKQQGETPNSRSTPSIIIGDANEELQPRGAVNISNESKSRLPPQGGFVDLEENSSRAPTGNNDSAENSQSTVSGLASVNSTVKSLDSVQRGARRGAARKKKQYHDDTSFAGYSAISQDTVETNHTSYTSPGAVSVEGIGSSSHNDSALEDNQDQNDRGTDMAPDMENDPHDLTPSLIVTARLVSENPLMPEFLEEHLERRIQEGVESRLRATQHDQVSKLPNEQSIITTVIAEPLDPAKAISHGAAKVNPVNPSETSSRKVCGLHPSLLIVLAVMVVIGAVTGVTVGITKSTESTTTAVPSSALLDHLQPWIVRSNDDRALLQDRSSPQARALDWLSRSIDSNNISEAGPRAVLLERYVVAVLYFSTNGPDWLIMQDYDFISTTTDVCSWNNNKPSFDTSASGIICGNRTNVEYILLEVQGLSGTIPWELGLLSDLLSLNMRFNDLSLSIPTELGQLTLLQEFMLTGNQLEGRIPSEIGQLTGLRMLWLDENQLTGTLPTELGRLSGLTFVALFLNSFSGVLPTELGQMIELQNFLAYNNRFRGTIPTELGKLSVLSVLNLSENSLTGTLPTELGKLIKILYFYVYNNYLSGTVPMSLMQLTDLLDLYLDYNTLTGTIPTELGKLSALIWLDFSSNSFIGTLPTELGQLTKLLYLYVDSNYLNGTVPMELIQLTGLEDLWLENNKLTGTIPTELGKLPTLARFFLSDNSFTGTLPTELGRLSQLLHLKLAHNLLNGTVPTEFGQLMYLSSLWLQANSLTGTIPTELGRLMSLQDFRAEMNGFTGSVPMAFSELSSLKFCSFHQNDLTGSVNDIFCVDARQWELLQSDCLATNYGTVEIECDCCTRCCGANGTDC